MHVGRPLAGLGSPQLSLSWCSRRNPVPPVLRFLPGNAGMLRPACPGLWWRCSEQCRTHTSFPEVRIMSLDWRPDSFLILG